MTTAADALAALREELDEAAELLAVVPGETSPDHALYRNAKAAGVRLAIAKLDERAQAIGGAM